MIDIDSDHTQPSNKLPSPLKISADDEWMSDDNIDSKMDIIRKQIKQKQ